MDNEFGSLDFSFLDAIGSLLSARDGEKRDGRDRRGERVRC